MLLDFNQTMCTERLIVILRGVPDTMLPAVLDVLYEAGIRLAEITYDMSGTVSYAHTAEMIAMASSRMAGKMYIGAGTVVTTEQVQMTADAGGTFIISPHTDTELIKNIKQKHLYALPGAMTVSEIVAAHNAGADYIKLFPASSLGPDFIRQVHGPLPQVKLLAVSGVSVKDVPQYLAAGAAGFGIGSAVANRKLCLENKLDQIYKNAVSYVSACRIGGKGMGEGVK
ncbi:MAG: bifunctional 4-hydroxy-2-oxoglutarate aldolase/2-dehydro-3-deoxy-phosphogluconate aldolase [Clostridia bacterium]|nr:bifunctional 4-hydroxy-2-oxoglutarate aldolase/2-dehydro-3-deoxy-phosphogluconate aldolase [Clostridia bacterium]